MTGPVFLFPGQGSQKVGMGKEFFDEYESVRDLFGRGSEAVGLDLEALCFEGPAETLVLTDNVQPAITLINLSVAEVLGENGITPGAAAGHSLGEYSALCAAGVLTFEDTMRLVRLRGQAMQDAADRHPGGMSAIIGLDAEVLEEICAEVADTGSVEVANHNSDGQVALTGEKDALEAAGALAKERGAKLVIPLKVSGPWHSRFMSEAQEAVGSALAECEISAPQVPVYANVTAEPHVHGQVAETLVRQLISPVRWMSSIKGLIGAGHTNFIEVGPGRVLRGLFKGIDRSVQALNVDGPDSLEKCLEALSASD